MATSSSASSSSSSSSSSNSVLDSLDETPKEQALHALRLYVRNDAARFKALVATNPDLLCAEVDNQGYRLLHRST
jgi:hypothetical protein